MKITIKTNLQQVFADNKEIKLTPSEYKLLLFFTQNRRLINYDEMKDNILYDNIQSNHSICNIISAINNNFSHKIINNKYGRGYFLLESIDVENL